MTYFELEKNFFIESSYKLMIYYTFFIDYGKWGDSSAIKSIIFPLIILFLNTQLTL